MPKRPRELPVMGEAVPEVVLRCMTCQWQHNVDQTPHFARGCTLEIN